MLAVSVVICEFPPAKREASGRPRALLREMPVNPTWCRKIGHHCKEI